MRKLIWTVVALVVVASAFAAPPTIKVDDDAAGKSNREELAKVAERVNLPSGKVAVDQSVAFQRTNAGMVLAGNQTQFANVGGGNDWVKGRAVVVRPGGVDGVACLSFYEPVATRPREMGRNEVGWLFDPKGSDGLGFYPAPVSRIGEGQKVPNRPDLAFMRAYHGVSFTGNYVLRVRTGHGLRFGDDVFATDGPYVNEVIPEWRKVVGTPSPDAVVLNERLNNTYHRGTLVAGPFPRNLWFQGLGFSGVWGPVLLQQACDVTFNDCAFEQSQGWTSVIGCGRVVFANCAMPSGVQSSASHDVRFRNCVIREVQGEQAAYDFRFDGCRFGPGPVDSKVHCVNWQIRDCVFRGSLAVYDAWSVTDCVCYGPVTVRGRMAVLRDVWSAQPVWVQSDYQGKPENAGTGIVLDGVVAPSIHCEPGTSGIIRRRSCPVTGDLTNWKVSPAQ